MKYKGYFNQQKEKILNISACWAVYIIKVVLIADRLLMFLCRLWTGLLIAVIQQLVEILSLGNGWICLLFCGWYTYMAFYK